MTNGELHDILDDKNKKISLKEFRNVLYELINDCVIESTREIDRMFFNSGQINAFYIALDLSEHIEESDIDVKD